MFPPTGGTPESVVIAAMERVLQLREDFDNGIPETQNADGSFNALNIKVCNMSLGGPADIVVHLQQRLGVGVDFLSVVRPIFVRGELVILGIINEHPRADLILGRHTRLFLESGHVFKECAEKAVFLADKLVELELTREFTRRVMSKLGNSFALEELRASLQAEQFRLPYGMTQEDQDEAQGIWMLARSNYEVQFQPDQELSQRIIFPATPSQRNGIEDARFTCFKNEDGTCIYYATFTAYDGTLVVPELLETSDFLRFRFITLNGPAAKNKGMAIFPRKIGGQYAMLSRQDNENIYFMYSDNIHFWYEAELLLKPTFPWEFVQLGNCGSPMETEAGWLVLSHGVGPMRKYCIGAFLLDRDDPTKVIGRLSEPLLKPSETEREGYVPNVVYSCGALIHNREVILPYAMSDYATNFATVSLDEILDAME